MTIGKKITWLRQKNGISQEELADRLEVSRQSVSKWEMDAAYPRIDKLIQMCTVFGVSTDELLKEEISFEEKEKPAVKHTSENHYFGTDGFRGEANIDLTAEQAC